MNVEALTLFAVKCELKCCEPYGDAPEDDHERTCNKELVEACDHAVVENWHREYCTVYPVGPCNMSPEESKLYAEEIDTLAFMCANDHRHPICM